MPDQDMYCEPVYDDKTKVDKVLEYEPRFQSYKDIRESAMWLNVSHVAWFITDELSKLRHYSVTNVNARYLPWIKFIKTKSALNNIWSGEY